MVRLWIVWPIKSPLLPVFLIGVILQIDLVVLVASAAGKIDDVSVARILRKEDGFFAQTIVIQVFVECSVTQMIGVEKVSSKESEFVDDFEQLGREGGIIEICGCRDLDGRVFEQPVKRNGFCRFIFEYVSKKLFFHVGRHGL